MLLEPDRLPLPGGDAVTARLRRCARAVADWLGFIPAPPPPRLNRLTVIPMYGCWSCGAAAMRDCSPACVRYAQRMWGP